MHSSSRASNTIIGQSTTSCFQKLSEKKKNGFTIIIIVLCFASKDLIAVV